MSIPIIKDSNKIGEQHFYIGYVKFGPNATSWASDFPIRAKTISSGAVTLLCEAIRHEIFSYSNFKKDVMAYAWTNEPGYPALRGKLRYNMFAEVKGNSLFDLNILYTMLRLTHVFGPFGNERFDPEASYSRYSGSYFNTPVINDRGEYTYEGLGKIITSLPVITTDIQHLKYNRLQDSFITFSLEDESIRLHLHVIVYSPREIEMVYGRNWLMSDANRKSSYSLIWDRFNSVSVTHRYNRLKWYEYTKKIDANKLFYSDQSTYSSVSSGNSKFDELFSSQSYVAYRNGQNSDSFNGYKMSLGYNFHGKGFKVYMPLFAYDFAHPALLWVFIINWLSPEDIVRRNTLPFDDQMWEAEHYE